MCPKGGRVCGDNVTQADCLDPTIFGKEYGVDGHCDPRYGWVARFRYTEEHDWESFWLHHCMMD